MTCKDKRDRASGPLGGEVGFKDFLFVNLLAIGWFVVLPTIFILMAGEYIIKKYCKTRIEFGALEVPQVDPKDIVDDFI